MCLLLTSYFPAPSGAYFVDHFIPSYTTKEYLLHVFDTILYIHFLSLPLFCLFIFFD